MRVRARVRVSWRTMPRQRSSAASKWQKHGLLSSKVIRAMCSSRADFVSIKLKSCTSIRGDAHHSI